MFCPIQHTSKLYEITQTLEPQLPKEHTFNSTLLWTLRRHYWFVCSAPGSQTGKSPRTTI